MADQSVTNLIKEIYDDVVKDVAAKQTPLLKKIRKNGNFGGVGLEYIAVNDYAPRSRTFATAQTNAGSVTYTPFLITTSDCPADYSIFTLSALDMKRSEGNPDSFVNSLKDGIKRHGNNLMMNLSRSLYGAGYGAFGKVTDITGATITLENPLAVTSVAVGGKVQFMDAEIGTTFRDSAQALTVDSRDASAGTITFTENVSEVSGAAVNDWVVVEGDAGSSTTTPARKSIAGLAGWVPTSAPSATLWFGTDRTTDVTGLAGWRRNTPSLSVEDNVQALISDVTSGVTGDLAPDFCVLNPRQYQEMARSLDSKRTYSEKSDGVYGFKYISIIGGQGNEVQVMADPHCPLTRTYVGKFDQMEVLHMGDLPELVEDDGRGSIRQSSADGIEVRQRTFAQVRLIAPASFGVAVLAAV